MTVNTYDFTLVLRGVDEYTVGLQSSLYIVGLGDAIVSFKNSEVHLRLCRTGRSYEEAVNLTLKQIGDLPGVVRAKRIACEESHGH